MPSDILLQILGVFAGAAGAYAAIKADLTRAILLAEQSMAAAKRAHIRMDTFLNEKGKNYGYEEKNED